MANPNKRQISTPSGKGKSQPPVSGTGSDDLEEWDVVEAIDPAKAALYGQRIQIGVGREQKVRDIVGAAAGAAFQVAKVAGAFGAKVGIEGAKVGIDLGGVVGKAAVGAIMAQLETSEVKHKKQINSSQKRRGAAGDQHPSGYKVRRLPPGYKFEERLSAGGQGTIELWRKTDTNQIFAAKVFNRGQARTWEADQEYKVYEALRKSGSTSKSVVHCMGIYRHIPLETESTLILEHCDLGDLEKWKFSLSRYSEPVDEASIWNVFHQLAEALALLHSGYGTKHYKNAKAPWTPIVHRDFKPCNVLMKTTAQSHMPSIKLCDFGMSAFKDRRFDPHFGSAGTPEYHGPPMGLMDTPGDIWALGATIHFLCVGAAPVDENRGDRTMLNYDPHGFYYRIPRRVLDIRADPRSRESLGRRQARDEQWNITYSQELHEIMMSTLDLDPKKRATAVELVTKIQNHVRSMKPNLSLQLAKEKAARDDRINEKRAGKPGQDAEAAKAKRVQRKRPDGTKDPLEHGSAEKRGGGLKRVSRQGPGIGKPLASSDLPFAKWAKPAGSKPAAPKPAAPKPADPKSKRSK